MTGRRKVIFRCVDPGAGSAAGAGLPVHVVDEDIYESRPSIVIGTVDKFAMMAWQSRQPEPLRSWMTTAVARYSPPGLIIQDELHLISGPLGSMVGLYEPVIDDL